MKLALVLVFGLLGTGVSRIHAKAKTSPVTWVFAVHDGPDGTPRGRVFLSVGGKQVLIEPKGQYQYQVLTRAEYAAHKIPAGALTACTGWWAGAGEDLYVVRRRGRLRVFRRWVDEEAPEFSYHLIKSLPLETNSSHAAGVQQKAIVAE